MTLSLRSITIAAVVVILPTLGSCARDTGLPKCVFAGNADWHRLVEQPPEAVAMLLSVKNTPIDPARLSAARADFQWFGGNHGQRALCYHSDPFCSPRQLTFLLENGQWTATQVDFQMCT
jgi:hypothetical protein